MLGREVTTPLDIQYCMPRSITHIPQNRWAWILKDKMEETHKHVRENVKGAMHRQKKYYDQKLSWQIFQKYVDRMIWITTAMQMTPMCIFVIEPLDKWTDISSRIEACLADISDWMRSNLLKLNQDKTELMVFAPKH